MPHTNFESFIGYNEYSYLYIKGLKLFINSTLSISKVKDGNHKNTVSSWNYLYILFMKIYYKNNLIFRIFKW